MKAMNVIAEFGPFSGRLLLNYDGYHLLAIKRNSDQKLDLGVISVAGNCIRLGNYNYSINADIGRAEERYEVEKGCQI